MRIFYELGSSILWKKTESAVALGMFDGVHRGHQQVIAAAGAYRDRYEVCVLTFTTKHHRPHRKADQQDVLTVPARLDRIAQMPVDTVCIPDFDAMRDLTADEFVRDILKKKFSAKVVCCGEDFRFGKGALGDVALLKQLCEQEGICVEIISPVLDQEEPISSTRIRYALTEGDIELANRLLGYCYFIENKVVYGKQLGRVLGCPTINQELDPFICLPRFGVYISSTEIDGVDYPSITNIGIKPTIKGDRYPLAETHVIGVKQDLYGRVLKVKLHRFIRDEMKFDNLDELAERIHQDIAQAELFFK